MMPKGTGKSFPVRTRCTPGWAFAFALGLLGVIVQGKLAGFVPSVRELTAKLEQVADFRLCEEVKSVAYQRAGE